MLKRKRVLSAGMAGMIAALAGAANGTVNYRNAGGQVNLSGSTLFYDFFNAPASTNAYINADGVADCLGNPYIQYDSNRLFGGCSPVDQLASLYSDGITTFWLVNYRGVGSGNGLGEFVDYQLCGLIPPSQPPANGTSGQGGLLNRTQYGNLGGGCSGSGTPECQLSMDAAVMDVPVKLFVVAGSAADAAWSETPALSGYGLNGRLSTTSYTNQLQSLSRSCPGLVSLNTNTSSPDANTLFETQVAWVPIAIICNRGVDLPSGNITMSELQSLYVTGRMPNGENLVGATRDSGSGTRNGTMNSIGVDPSWGVGDNLGTKQADSTVANLGSSHQADNLDGSGIMESVVQNRRLAIGYTGLAGASRAAGKALGGKFEILNIKKDVVGGAQYVRPTINSVVHNTGLDTGYQIGGNETFVTRGDPNAGMAGNTHPAMTNSQAASYIRNIVESISGFSASPGQSADFNMPGEFLAYTFFLAAAVDALPDLNHPTSFVDQTATSNFNPTLQSFVLANNGMGIGGDTPSYGITTANFVPKRNSAAYSDGSTNGNYYNMLTHGYDVSASQQLNERNRTAGDFNYAGSERHKRNLNDIPNLMMAIHDPRAFEAGLNWGGSAGGLGADFVVPEIIGDFDGDGNFDDHDVRYFADGLAIDPVAGNLDRKKGFTAVDSAWTYNDRPGHPAGNYFNTVLATGKSYAAGDSRGDVAGSAAGPNAGGPPAGSDGVIDAKDIDYVCGNTHWVLVGPAGYQLRIIKNWPAFGSQQPMDLSADLNGDLVVDGQDVAELIHSILGTEFGDVNLDGKVDAADEAIISEHLGQAGGWAQGDMNCDGVVNSADHDVWLAHNGFVRCQSAADCNDGNGCTTDGCVLGTCIHTPVNCDDGDACTVDACDPQTGQCLHTPMECPVNTHCVNGQCVPSCDPLLLVSAVSRKTHGGTMDFDVPLYPIPVAGPRNIECRAGGPTKVVITFNEPVNPGTVSVVGGLGVVAPGPGANQATVTLTGVAERTWVAVTLNGFTNTCGGALAGSNSVTVGALQGDTNGDGQVGAADISQTKSNNGKACAASTLNTGNFRVDVNTDCQVGAADISFVKSRNGNALP